MKQSTAKNIANFYGIIVTAGCGSNTMYWLTQIFTSESTATKTMSTIVAVFYFLITMLYGSLIACDIGERIKNYRQGILEDPIAADHGTTLIEVIFGIHDEATEHLAYFAPDGRKIGESTTHNPHSVAFFSRREVKLEPGYISVHNHPGKENLAFSPNDFASAIARKERRAIVVADDVCYILDIPGNHKLRAHRVYSAAYKAYAGGFNDLASSLLSCNAVAKRYGFRFYVIPLAEIATWLQTHTVGIL